MERAAGSDPLAQSTVLSVVFRGVAFLLSPSQSR